MELKHFICLECGDNAYQVVQKRGEVCFKCHIKGIKLAFTYGKETFTGPTIGELQRKTISDAAANGIKAEPVGSRWI